MYSELVQVTFPGGIHNGTLDALRPFGPQGLRLQGLDPNDTNQWRSLMEMFRDPTAQVELTVENADPQMARDIAVIAKKMIHQGRNIWPGRVIPPDQYNKGANYIRMNDGLPQEGPMQVGQQQAAPVQAKHLKSSTRASVSGEMANDLAQWSVLSPSKKEATWHVVSLGELQQPGGVGGTQPYNPVTDGPNPDGPDFLDNADNSYEQQTALQTWVNYAVEMINAGDDEQVIVAKLAHDGCPDPEDVLERAKMQPVEEMPGPISDEIGQDPFEVPPQSDQSGTGQMESVSQQPPVLGAKRVRIVDTSLKGTEVDRWEDLWGQGTVKIALDDGGTMNVAPDAVEEIESEEIQHPVSQIQEFINGLPVVEPTRPHIEARIANMKLVRKACRENISKVGFSDKVKLDTIDSDAKNEILTLTEFLGAVVSESDMAYLSGLQTYRPHGTNYPGIAQGIVVNEDFNKKINEKAAIFVAELDESIRSDSDSVAYAAARFAYDNNGNIPEFVELAEKNRMVMADSSYAKCPKCDSKNITEYTDTRKASCGDCDWKGTTVDVGIDEKKSNIDNDGPAEGLFL